jgi:aminoglycoside phosphotransferase (APT) family kinase protein
MTESRRAASTHPESVNRLGVVGKVGLIRPGPRRTSQLRDVPQDSALPHLAAALDAARMHEVFQRTLFADGSQAGDVAGPNPECQVQRCEIEWVKYRPGKNCTVAYRIGLHHRATQQESEHLVCARVFEPGRSLARFQAVRAADLVNPEHGRPITHLPEMDTIVWSFPNDSKLHALPEILDADRLRCELLPEVAEAAAGPGWAIAQVRRDVVQYVPEETCTVRVCAQLERVATGERQEVIFYGKLYKEGQGAGTYELMRELWESDARSAGHLRMAQPLGYDIGRSALWQAGVPGTALLEEDLTGPRSNALLASAARSVAALHTAGVSCPRSVAVADAQARLRDMRRLLPQITPSCRGALEPLIDRLLAQGEQLGEQPVAVLHGDLRLRHILVDGDAVGLIDVDTLCHGSPWQDIGSFAAAVLYKGMLTGVSDSVIRDILASFYAHYARCVPWRASNAVVTWFTAVALINERAFRAVTRLQQDALERVDELVDHASRISRAVEFGFADTRDVNDLVWNVSPARETGREP